MMHLKLQIGDVKDRNGAGALNWISFPLSVEEFKKLTDDQVIEYYLAPALRRLVQDSRDILNNVPIKPWC